jgi:anti-anti-sigma factor
MALTVVSPSEGDVQAALRTRVSAEGGFIVVTLAGEADFSTTMVLSDTLAKAIALGAGDVVMDLAELEFMDSATARVLAAAEERLVRRGRKLTFRTPRTVAARVLHLFGLSGLIEVREVAAPT